MELCGTENKETLCKATEKQAIIFNFEGFDLFLYLFICKQ